MSALANNEIPTITTAEQVAAWASLVLARVNPSLAVLESSDESTAVAQVAIIRSSTGAPRLVARLSIELDAAYNPGSPMSLGIEYETDEVRNVNEPEDKFQIFTHGAITANTVGVLDFAGVMGLWRIYAVWLDMTGVTASDAMEITINNGGNVTAYWNLPATEVPWQPPPNIIGAANTIFIRPTSDVSNVILYAKPAELDTVLAV